MSAPANTSQTFASQPFQGLGRARTAAAKVLLDLEAAAKEAGAAGKHQDARDIRALASNIELVANLRLYPSPRRPIGTKGAPGGQNAQNDQGPAEAKTPAGPTDKA